MNFRPRAALVVLAVAVSYIPVSGDDSLAASAIDPLSVPAASQAPEIRLEGRDSLAAMERFAPFLGVWRFVESPPGTPLESSLGAIYFRSIMKGMAVESGEGSENNEVPGFHILWHPIDRRYVFRKFEPRNPTDLMFEGEYEFVDDHTLIRTYTGYYGDGRIHRYRETFVIGPENRLTTTTERFMEGEWRPIFDTYVAERAEGALP